MSKLFRTLIIFIAIIIPSLSLASNFFEEQYRGWLWFEEKEQGTPQGFTKEQNNSSTPTKEEMQQAKLENEAFREELESLRHLMVRYPDNLAYIRIYKEKEKQMLEGAMTLARNFATVNFLNPGLADQLKSPQNIYARNIAKSEKEQQDRASIKSLAGQVELFVFRQEGCAHCPTLEKHLNSFANTYGFKVEAVSSDHSISPYFKTHNNPALIKQLRLSVMPAVIAVTKDSSMRFELARGAVSIPDLEDKALLLVEYFARKQHEPTVQQSQDKQLKQLKALEQAESKGRARQ